MLKKRLIPSVSFATCVWEKDWRFLLLDSDYLNNSQIANHLFPFSEKILIINNVKDVNVVLEHARKKVSEGVLTRLIVADEIEEEVFSHFALCRSDFEDSPNSQAYKKGAPNWLFYNARGPLCALYAAQSDYLLYMTGDVHLKKPVNWILKAIQCMEKRPSCKVANLVWNDCWKEAFHQSYRFGFRFFRSKEGFSDQMFLVKTNDFRQPIYKEIHPESGFFPPGPLWEKRAFSAMKFRGWERLIYAHGSYTHQNFE